jgi:hypothetical protein
MKNANSTRGVGDFLGTDEWRIRRLFEDGTLPEPDRFAGRRIITSDMIPAIVDALRARGWLPAAAEQVGSTEAAV